MAYKIRHALTGETTITFDKIEMLRIEQLLRVAEGAHTFFNSEERQWLSSTQDLFRLEGSPGEYTI